MWNFYDELCTGIPSGIRIDQCIVGEKLTVVSAADHIGVARTLCPVDAETEKLAKTVEHTFLRDAANWMKWDCPVRACIGVAAMNAFYNRSTRLADGVSVEFCGEINGKKVTLIGDLPEMEECLKVRSNLTVLPLPEECGLDAQYDNAMIADVVVISGDALINRTLPALLAKVGDGVKVILAGFSVPAAPVFFAFGNPVHGLICRYAETDSVEEVLRGSGMNTFRIAPEKPSYVHDNPEVTRYNTSPYKASKFNSAFNPWEGKEYDGDSWSPIFLG